MTGSRSPGGRCGPAGHHDGTVARIGHARAQLRAHHEEIFQFRYAGLRVVVDYLEAITYVNYRVVIQLRVALRVIIHYFLCGDFNIHMYIHTFQ